MTIVTECFVPPSPNVLVVRWKVENWNEQTRQGQKPPVWFSLYRWADPTIQEFAARFFADSRHGAFQALLQPEGDAAGTAYGRAGWWLDFHRTDLSSFPAFRTGLSLLDGTFC